MSAVWWVAIGIGWCVVSVPVALWLGRVLRARETQAVGRRSQPAARPVPRAAAKAQRQYREMARSQDRLAALHRRNGCVDLEALESAFASQFRDIAWQFERLSS